MLIIHSFLSFTFIYKVWNGCSTMCTYLRKKMLATMVMLVFMATVARSAAMPHSPATGVGVGVGGGGGVGVGVGVGVAQRLQQELELQERTTLFHRHAPPRRWRVTRPVHRRHIERVMMTFTVALRQRRTEALDTLFWQLTDPKHTSYGRWRTPQQVLRQVAPRKQHHDAVVDWLRAYIHADAAAGTTSRQSSIVSHGDAITVTTSVARVQELFHTRIYEFEREFVNDDGNTDAAHSRGVVYAHLGSISMPARVARHVSFVSGLSYFPMPLSSSSTSSSSSLSSSSSSSSSSSRKSSSSSGVPPPNPRQASSELSIVPSTLLRLYNVSDVASPEPSTRAQRHNRVAVWEFLGSIMVDVGYVPSDFRVLNEQVGLNHTWAGVATVTHDIGKIHSSTLVCGSVLVGLTPVPHTHTHTHINAHSLTRHTHTHTHTHAHCRPMEVHRHHSRVYDGCSGNTVLQHKHANCVCGVQRMGV